MILDFRLPILDYGRKEEFEHKECKETKDAKLCEVRGLAR
jgi:hypothetical protein